MTNFAHGFGGQQYVDAAGHSYYWAVAGDDVITACPGTTRNEDPRIGLVTLETMDAALAWASCPAFLSPDAWHERQCYLTFVAEHDSTNPAGRVLGLKDLTVLTAVPSLEGKPQ